MKPFCPTHVLGRCIQPLIKTCPLYPSGSKKKPRRQILSEFGANINILYNDIHAAATSIVPPLSGGCFRANVIRDAAKFKRPSSLSLDSHFLPENIKTHIKEKEYAQLHYTCTIGGRDIEVIYTLFNERELADIKIYNEYVKLVYIWLSVCIEYSQKHCSKTLTIHFYLTHFLKQLPDDHLDILGPNHVNSAFSSVCAPQGEMIIYRKEEWLKVFIHETFHAYGFDIGLHDSRLIQSHMVRVFKLDIDYNIGEAYTETWARIINCVLYSYQQSIRSKKKKEFFYEYVHASLQLERLYSVFQMQKMLAHMKLSYKNIVNNSPLDLNLKTMMYKENTAIFGYFIAGGIFMSDFMGYLEWCATYNSNILQFQNTDATAKKLASFLTTTARSKSITRLIECIEKGLRKCSDTRTPDSFINTTSRMTLIDYMCY